MAVTTMTTAVFAPRYADDQVVFGSASGAAVTTYGDWVAASSYWVGGANTGWIATPAYRTSGMGIALDQNPTYDELGVSRSNSALPIATRGIFRVTAASGASAEFPVWTPVRPLTTGSGIVGQTGATGIGAIWGTAAVVSISANIGALTGTNASGVGRILRVITDGATGQWDIVIKSVGDYT